MNFLPIATTVILGAGFIALLTWPRSISTVLTSTWRTNPRSFVKSV